VRRSILGKIAGVSGDAGTNPSFLSGEFILYAPGFVCALTVLMVGLICLLPLAHPSL
jgi:hypothetical protein